MTEISVFIPYYNDSKYLNQSITSVLNQSFVDFELILLNHASTDNSREIARSFNDHRIIHIDLKKNYGAGGGILLNAFLKVAKGKYIKLFCADDVLKKNCLQEFYSLSQKNPETSLFFSDVEYIDGNGNDLHDSWFNSREFFSLHDNEIDCIKKYRDGKSFLPFSGAFFRKHCLFDLKVDKTMIMFFDMSLWLQILLNGNKIKFITKKLSYYRIHNGQVSSLSNINDAEVRAFFELPIFQEIFYKAKNFKIIKESFSESEYIDKLSCDKDIPFIVAKYFWNLKLDQVTFYRLYKLVNDQKYGTYLKNKFNYDIANLRSDYSYKSVHKIQQEQNNCLTKKTNIGFWGRFKANIFAKESKKLNPFDLIFLFVRRIITCLNFRLYKTKKKYSL